jgi:hydroxymethylpyrimidine pyrophosphatase-like HAD family hydrolase
MVSSAGLGVAMGNSHADVLKCADRVIGSNREDGLAAFLEELLDTKAVAPAERN